MSVAQNFNNVLLHLYNNDKTMLSKIFNSGFEILFLATNESGDNLLQVMIFNRDISLINNFLDHIIKCKYDPIIITKIINNKNQNGDTPFILATRLNLQEIAKRLDIMGVDKSVINKQGEQVTFVDDNTNADIELSATSAIAPTDDYQKIVNDIKKPIKNGTEQNIPSVLDTVSTTQTSGDIVNSESMKPTLSEGTSEKSLGITTELHNKIDVNQFIKFLDNEYKQNKKQHGGSKKINYDNSDDEIDYSDTLGIQHLIREQRGGAKNIIGKRKVSKHDMTATDSESESENNSDTLGIQNLLDEQNGGRKSKKSRKSKKTSKHSLSRKDNPASIIHTEVIDMIKKLGYSEEDARFIKAGLYQMVKEKFDGLSNMQRALKMKELTTEDEVKKIEKHLPKLKEIVSKAIEQRKLEKEKLQQDTTSTPKSKKNASKKVDSDDDSKKKKEKKSKKQKQDE